MKLKNRFLRVVEWVALPFIFIGTVIAIAVTAVRDFYLTYKWQIWLAIASICIGVGLIMVEIGAR